MTGFGRSRRAPADYDIDHFTIQFNEGPLSYRYGTIICADKVRFCHRIWNMEKKETESALFAGIEDGFLEKFSDKIEELDLQALEREGRKDVKHTPAGYLEVYIDYKSGRQIYGEYEGDEIPEDWTKSEGDLRAFFDAYIDAHLEASGFDELSEISGGVSG